MADEYGETTVLLAYLDAYPAMVPPRPRPRPRGGGAAVSNAPLVAASGARAGAGGPQELHRTANWGACAAWRLPRRGLARARTQVLSRARWRACARTHAVGTRPQAGSCG